MMKRKLIVALCLITPLSLVARPGRGFRSPTSFSSELFFENYSTSQKARLVLTTVKSLARLFALDQSNDLLGRKQALVGQLIACVADLSQSMVSSGIDSKLLSGNAALWQLLKLHEEHEMLEGVTQNFGEEQLLQEHYHGNDSWLDELDSSDTAKDAKKFLRFLLIVAEWGACMYAIHHTEISSVKSAIAEVVRASCDFLLRYLCNYGLYKSNSMVGKIECVSSALPHLYQIAKTGVKFRSYQEHDAGRHERERKKRIEHRRQESCQEIERDIERQKNSYYEQQKKRREERRRKQAEEDIKNKLACKDRDEREIKQENEELLKGIKNKLKKKLSQENLQEIETFIATDDDHDMGDCHFCTDNYKRRDAIMFPCCYTPMHEHCWEMTKRSKGSECPFCRKYLWYSNRLFK